MTPRIGLLLFTALLMQCENPVETPLPGVETVPAQIRQTDCFNGGNALFHAARITEMGNRASGTPGYRRQMDYLKEELAKCGWTCREQAFEKELAAGYDVLYLGFSSGLSGSFNTSCIARDSVMEKYPEGKIICIDSLCASTGEGLLLIKADEKKKQGLSIDELAQWITDNRLHLCHVFTVDDLKYLHRGGRVSKTAAIAGSILGIKPLLHVDNEGHLIPVGKIRGRKQSIEKLVDMMCERMGNWDNSTVAVCHGDCLSDAEYAADLMRKKLGKKTTVHICYTGAVIGSHSGPGTLALFFMGDQR